MCSALSEEFWHVAGLFDVNLRTHERNQDFRSPHTGSDVSVLTVATNLSVKYSWNNGEGFFA